MTRIYEDKRPVPPDVILEDYLEDIELGMLKRGKEAEVYLVERRAQTRSCLLAAKRYLPFEERTFKHNVVYRAHNERQVLRRDGDRKRAGKAGGGVRRAIARGTDFGKRTLYESWVAAEWGTLNRLWDAGAPVPYPVERTHDGFLMQFIGNEEQAAPRLAQARISREELPALFDRFREGLLAFAHAGIVHADLSPYNILVWKDDLCFIDVPQAVPYLANDQATDFLYRDVQNVCAWFTRRGHEVDAEALFAEALSDLFEYRMTDLFAARE